MKEAALYSKLESDSVRCYLCRHGCVIKPGQKGICAVRENRDGVLYSLVYDKLISANLDPIEKKPLFHVAPGTSSYSIATPGCNLKCSFCQNYSISQMPRDRGVVLGEAIKPDQIARSALQKGCSSIAYTYTEPTIYFELAKETMEVAKELGLLNIFVTNGYMSLECLDETRGLLDAANVDLKSFREEFYKEYCGARLQGVLDNLQRMKELGIFLEVTTLLIPGLNESADEVRELARFIKNALGPETPWHVSRFHPQYKELTRAATNVETVRKVREIGLEEGLCYVYTGNLPGDNGEKSFCPQCATTVIDRVGYRTRENRARDGRCPECGHGITGIRI
jgi:pyruvate formate lyase activating enzyme